MCLEFVLVSVRILVSRHLLDTTNIFRFYTGWFEILIQCLRIVVGEVIWSGKCIFFPSDMPPFPKLSDSRVLLPDCCIISPGHGLLCLLSWFPCWRHHPWCGVRNAFGILEYSSREYTVIVLFHPPTLPSARQTLSVSTLVFMPRFWKCVKLVEENTFRISVSWISDLERHRISCVLEEVWIPRQIWTRNWIGRHALLRFELNYLQKLRRIHKNKERNEAGNIVVGLSAEPCKLNTASVFFPRCFSSYLSQFYQRVCYCLSPGRMSGCTE